MLSESQLYISASNKDFLPTGLDNSSLVSPVGIYEIAKISENPWVTGESLSGYAYFLNKPSSSAVFAQDHWSITLNQNNEFSILYSGESSNEVENSVTELFCSGINDEGSKDIYLPSGWITESGNQINVEINDKFYQQEIFKNGSPDLSYKLTKDLSLTYVDNLNSAEALEYNTFEGWEIDVKEEGLFSYYIKLEENDKVNDDFVFVDRGPIIYISRFFIDAFNKERDPDFDIQNPKNILIKKGKHNNSEQSFSDRNYDEAVIDNPSRLGDTLNFGDPSWFLNESYILKEIPSQEMFDQQEELSLLERDGAYLPTRDNLIQFEQDSTLNLSPITGYYSFKGESDCKYSKEFFKYGENRNWQEDWEKNNRRYLHYLTISNFLYNVIKKIETNGINIEGSDLDSFLTEKLGANYLTEKEISTNLKDFQKIKIGYNENCNVFQRRLYYYGDSAAYVEWSLHHKNPNNPSIIHDSVYRRIYSINDSFEHNAINYSVIDFVPFKDFGMEPVSWSK